MLDPASSAPSHSFGDAMTFRPTRVLEIELSRALPCISPIDPRTGRQYGAATVLVRLHSTPLGQVHLPLGTSDLQPSEYAHRIWQELSGAINEHLQRDDLPHLQMLPMDGLSTPERLRCKQAHDGFEAHLPFVSVVVTTRERPQELKRCLKALVALAYPRFEVLIVDNAPRTSATAEVVAEVHKSHPFVQYLREDRPGASWGRNRGWQSSLGSIIAFTDDDTEVDPHWLSGLTMGFQAAQNVGCVSGLTLTAELETPAQEWFEQFSSFSFGFQRVIHNIADRPLYHQHSLYPYSAIKYGVSVNIAYSAEALQECGGFCTTLGAGTPSLAGEDVEMYLRMLFKGYTAVYEPFALLYHYHRRDYEELRKQAFGYGSGTTAFALRIAMSNPARFFELTSKVPRLLFSLLHPNGPKNQNRSSQFPKELSQLELRGMLYGPFGYLRSQWNLSRTLQTNRELARSKPPPTLL